MRNFHTTFLVAGPHAHQVALRLLRCMNCLGIVSLLQRHRLNIGRRLWRCIGACQQGCHCRIQPILFVLTELLGAVIAAHRGDGRIVARTVAASRCTIVDAPHLACVVRWRR
jgi:hypothetical protein